jgi:predicted RNA-binding protein with PUA-like domain
VSKLIKYWLMKTEPDVFSWADLLSARAQTCSWEGVRNYQARNFMRDDFSVDDQVLFYHSSCDEPGIAGLARVARAAYPDPSALDPQSPYFDEKSAGAQQSRWVMVDVQAVKAFKRVATLKELRDHKELKDLLLLRPGQRLSIQPVSAQHANIILQTWCGDSGI